LLKNDATKYFLIKKIEKDSNIKLNTLTKDAQFGIHSKYRVIG
jgi:hypothetical protein